MDVGKLLTVLCVLRIQQQTNVLGVDSLEHLVFFLLSLFYVMCILSIKHIYKNTFIFYNINIHNIYIFIRFSFGCTEKYFNNMEVTYEKMDL